MSEETMKLILEEGRKEFIAHGFPGASLRNIAKNAGVTTGAFYGYYRSKHELFDALVGEQYNTILARYAQEHEDFRKLTPEEQVKQMGQISGEDIMWMADYVYDHFEAFRLILCCAEGTKYVSMIHEMSELEVKATEEFMQTLRQLGQNVPEIDPMLEHMLVSGMLTAFFEMVIHNLPREKVHEYVKLLQEFYLAGWKKLMQMD